MGTELGSQLLLPSCEAAGQIRMLAACSGRIMMQGSWVGQQDLEER